MLQVRKVRVEDVKLRSIRHAADPAGGEPGEGVLLKAETHSNGMRPDVAAMMLDWASVHMNLGIANAQPPGKELLVALADEPNQPVANSFRGASINDGRTILPANGYVEVPAGTSTYTLVLTPNSADGEDARTIEVSFEGNHAWEFVQALLWGWLRYDEE